jgi:K+-sensing histidine kinase KdpD
LFTQSDTLSNQQSEELIVFLLHEAKGKFANAEQVIKFIDESDLTSDEIKVHLSNLITQVHQVCSFYESSKSNNFPKEDLTIKDILEQLSFVYKQAEYPEEPYLIKFSKLFAQFLADNLLQNIKRYVGNVEKAKPFINYVVLDTNHIEIHIIDDGPGYSDSLIESGFQPVESTQGWGIGMAYLAKIINVVYGGKLSPSKRLDGKQGAETILRLPISGFRKDLPPSPVPPHPAQA